MFKESISCLDFLAKCTVKEIYIVIKNENENIKENFR